MPPASDTRTRLLRRLKRHGPATVDQLSEALGISANAIRHHLVRLRGDGFVTEAETSGTDGGPGRPARPWGLTAAAEGEFPKRYHDLLDLVLEQAQAQDLIAPLLRSVAERLAERVRPELEGLPPRERLRALMERLDYGEMLGVLEDTEGGWSFGAYNCVYRDTGCRFLEVCELLPRVIRLATDLPAERVECQRDGGPVCRFAGGYREA